MVARYGNAAPVRVGNAATTQFQLDVYGEVMDTLHLARAAGQTPQPHAWRIQCALLAFLQNHWRTQTKASGKFAGRGGTSRIPR